MEATLSGTTSNRSGSEGQTVWGLNLLQLHDYYWAARGVQVVRLDDRSSLVAGPELYLLTDHDHLLLFRMRPLLCRKWLCRSA